MFMFNDFFCPKNCYGIYCRHQSLLCATKRFPFLNDFLILRIAQFILFFRTMRGPPHFLIIIIINNDNDYYYKNE